MSTSKILLIYTGGTIGMELDAESGGLVPLPFEKLLHYVPELSKIPCEIDHHAFKNPVDSSDATPEFWNDIAEVIEKNYEEYGGFVVLHGTDTMAYTASALSFMFENLSKPIVITGSQLPMGTLRTDGRENLISAIEVAASMKGDLPILTEVAVYFEYSLYRGNRSHKFSTEHFDAIISPNYHPLAEAGVHINWDYNALQRNSHLSQNTLKVNYNWSSEVAIVKLFPGILKSQFEYLMKAPDTKVYILETFGSGNLSMNSGLIEVIEKAIVDGNVIVNLSQCRKGSVDQETYSSGIKLANMGVISAQDMTLEATVTKCMHLLASSEDIQEFKNKFQKDMCRRTHNKLGCYTCTFLPLYVM